MLSSSLICLDNSDNASNNNTLTNSKNSLLDQSNPVDLLSKVKEYLLSSSKNANRGTKNSLSLTKYTNITIKADERFRTYSEKIYNAGYRLEEHKIITDDQYILTAWRIPGKLNDTITKKKKPIIMQHGLLDDSFTWLVLDNSKNLAIKFANLGYDVWLTNVRGNCFSYEHMNHEEYNSDSMNSKYWDFSLDEIIQYDFPAIIKYVKFNTEYEKVMWMGHSQGTFMFFHGFAMYPEFTQNSIEKFAAVGTVFTEFKMGRSWGAYLLTYTHLLDFLHYLGFDNLMLVGTPMHDLIHRICANGITSICLTVIECLIETKPTNRINLKEVSDLLWYEPGGTSNKNLNQWLQIFRNQKLTKYDYGKVKNQEVYGQPEPPAYDLTQYGKWEIPTYLTRSDVDPYSNDDDLDVFLKLLSDDQKKRLFTIQKLQNYNHLDYLWSDDADKDIYPLLVDFFGKNPNDGNGNDKKENKKDLKFLGF